LLQRLLVLDVRLLVEPLIDGFIEQLGYSAILLARDLFQSGFPFALETPAVDLGFHAPLCSTERLPRQEPQDGP
jgi:hypothetical protein